MRGDRGEDRGAWFLPHPVASGDDASRRDSVRRADFIRAAGGADPARRPRAPPADSGAPVELGPEGFDHLTGRRPHPAPQAEGLRALLHQHAGPVHRDGRAGGPTPKEKGGRLTGVHHVVAGSTGAKRTDGNRGGPLPGEAPGGRVDHDVELRAAEVAESARLHPVVGEPRRKRRRAIRRAVDDHQPTGPLFEDGGKDPPRRAPRTDHEEIATRERHPVVVPEVPDEADPVRVVAVDGAVVPERQGVDRPRTLGPGGPGVGEGERFLLERQGHVHAEPAVGPKTAHDRLEAVQRARERIVAEALPGHRREPSVNERRLRVPDGMARHRVSIGRFRHLVRTRSARADLTRVGRGGGIVSGPRPRQGGRNSYGQRDYGPLPVPPARLMFACIRWGVRMVKPTRVIENVIRRVHEALPVEEIGEDLRRNIAEAVGAALDRMDVVTREELDAHLETLAEAHARMEALEERIEAIEAGSPGRTADG